MTQPAENWKAAYDLSNKTEEDVNSENAIDGYDIKADVNSEDNEPQSYSMYRVNHGYDNKTPDSVNGMVTYV